jgi:hypothetical protein
VPAVPLWQQTAIYGATTKLSWKPTTNQSMFVDQMTLQSKN